MNARSRIFRRFAASLAALALPAALAVMPETGMWAIDSEVNGQPGRGFQVDAQGATMVLTFFGYGVDGSAQWYYSAGKVANDAYAGKLEQFAGGTAFGAARTTARATTDAGNFTLAFRDATHGTITLPGEPAKAVSRLAFGGGAGSAGVKPTSGMWVIDAEVNGEPGRGFQIDVQGGILVLTFYGYGADGAPRWYYADGALSANAFSGALLQFVRGTTFGGAWVPASAAGTVGTVTLTFRDNTHGTITLPGEPAKAVSRLVFDRAAEVPAFTMSQTLSDGAQRTTLAFSGLAMMTGNLGAQSFFPPGKVADYTGFQYLRDNDPDGMGHNTSFLTRVANNVLYILDDAQLAKLKSVAASQLGQIELYGYKRYSLMKAFRRQLEGDLPPGSSGLNLAAVKAASRELYLIDGQISYDRALLYAQIVNSFTASQRAWLDAMKGKGWSSWPDIADAQVRSRLQGLPQGTMVAVMTYAGDLFSWYAGSLEADVYFCPERHGTYYGGFYIKDAPAIGHEGYAIDEQLTATAGAALSDASKGYVTAAQAAVMSGLVETQRNNLYASAAANIVGVRTEIASLLRSLLVAGTSAEAVRSRVLAVSAVYGELDGENNHAYATVFAQVYKTLTVEQKAKMAALRKSIMSGTYADGTTFDFSAGSSYYLYSEIITDASVLAPYVGNTDWLFFAP